MSNTRYVNGYECPICFELYPTERRANNCFKKCKEDCVKGYDVSKDKVKLIAGFECCDCGKLYARKMDAGDCCNMNYPEERGDANYDKINYPNRTKVVLCEEVEE